MRTIPSFISVLVLLTTAVRAEEVADREIQQITAKFTDKRQKAQRAALANYADSLAALRQELLASGKAGEAEIVATELKQIMAQLNGASTAAGTNAPSSPADMEELFTELQKPQQKPEARSGEGEKVPAKPESDKPPKIRIRYDLEFKNANLSNGSYTEEYWQEGASATWNLNDLPPGEYTVRLTYRGDPDQKPGECQISIQGTETPLTAPIKPEGRRTYRLDVGRVKLANTGDKFRIAAAKVANNKTLFQLSRVTLIPFKEGEAPPATEEDPN